MPRLVELQACQNLPPVLHVQVGDLMMFGASGGRLMEGAAVELTGVFSTSVLSDDGRMLSPAGPPATVMFRAIQAGQARIEVIRGDPWQTVPPRQQIAIVVEE